MSNDKVSTRKTPGVYVTELDAFPPSVVGVQTAVPAFIGYTQKAEISGKPAYLKPIKLTSLADYQHIFGVGNQAVFDLVQLDASTALHTGQYDFRVMEGSTWGYYDLVQTADSKFNLYSSLELFYANGGDECYVVSVGGYSQPGLAPNGTHIDPKMLTDGLESIADQVGPTLLLIPDAVLLTCDDENTPWESSSYQSIVRQMLKQCEQLQDRVAILDVYGSQYTNQANLDDICTRFREDVGDQGLSYGMAYFPDLETTLSDDQQINTNYIDQSSLDILSSVLSHENTNVYGDSAQATATQQLIKAISTTTPTDTQAIATLSQSLAQALPLWTSIQTVIAQKLSQLPPSGAMAGIYTTVDNTNGVWNAPANIAVSAVNKPCFAIDDQQQGNLNVPLDGKAINAIREFTGRGTVVWGARTLDGNSNDWRYIQVRRTIVYIEQSIQLALDQFVFASNNGKTWVTVTSMVSGFLQSLWSQGGLMGSTASEAFSVECGLGSTMTSQDVLDGYMIVQVALQMIRPAEFIELTFKQKMEGAG